MFNVACGERVTLNELVSKLGSMAETDFRPLYGPDRPGDVKHSVADISRARSELGYEPAVDFSEGLKRTLAYYRQRTQGE